MNQKQSEDFDSTIRRLANDAESDYQAHSWMLMEKLLDRKKEKKILWWYWPLGIFVGATIIGLGVSQFASKVSSIQSIGMESDLNATLVANDSKSALDFSIKSTADQIFKNEYDSDLREKSNQLIKDNRAQLKNNSTQKDINNYDIAQINTENVKDKFNHIRQKNSNADRFSFKNKSNRNSIQSYQANQLTMESPSKSDESTLADVHSPIDGSHVSTIVNRNFVIPLLPSLDYSFTYERNIQAKNWDQKIIPVNTHHHSSSILFGISFSPEYTSVSQRAYGQLSNTHGIAIGYQINRWSFYTGIEKSIKYYDAMKGDYEIPETSYYYNLKVDNIGAVCNVLQVPMTIQYRLMSKKGFSLHARLGLSSMRMDKEVYNWDYYHKDWSKGHTVSSFASKNWYLFAAASAGIQIQKSINRHVGITLTPYYVSPLKGIGHGNTKLNSFGSQVGIYYQMNTRK